MNFCPDLDFEENFLVIDKENAKLAFNRIQTDSVRKRLNNLSKEDIEAEIYAARKEKLSICCS